MPFLLKIIQKIIGIMNSKKSFSFLFLYGKNPLTEQIKIEFLL
jgi:hypothetical protein